jgi:PTH1 family peptidyl-tRNA hydrolase
VKKIAKLLYNKTNMKVIFAQGNPGQQYTSTRHNVGFMLLDKLADKAGESFVKKPKFHADIAEMTLGGEKTLLVKPTTFYNETGQAARLICDFYKLQPATDLLVIHDDLALPLGTIRTRHKGSDAGNNGIKSLNSHLGPDYMRLRIGIYSDLRDRMPDADFVLSMFKKDEYEFLHRDIFPEVARLVEQFAQGSLDASSLTLPPAAQ